MRSNRLIAASAALLLLLCATTAGARTRSSSAHTGHSKSTVKKTTSKSVRGGSKSSRNSRHRKYAASKKPSGPARQLAPTPERYSQIQQALADRGYYKGPVNGEWNAESIEALKRFEADQNLTPDGKIDSLSLIALGLGPKRETAGDFASRPATEPAAIP